MKFSLKYKARGVGSLHQMHDRLQKMKKDYAVVIYHTGEYPSGTPVGDVADILENVGVHEKNKKGQVGRPNVKRWPFSKNVRARNYNRRWRKMISGIADNIVRGNLKNYHQGYQNLGRLIVSQLYEEICAMEKPPLAQSTIDKKGHSKPLMDTLRLLKSIRYKVVPLNDPSARSKPFMPKWVGKTYPANEFGSAESTLSNLETDLLKLLYEHGLVDKTHAMRPYDEWKNEYAATMKSLFSGDLEQYYNPSEKYKQALSDFIGHNWEEDK